MVSTEFSTYQYTCVIQNHRQKVFNRGALQFCGGICVCAGGLDIIAKFDLFIVFHVSIWGGLELC